MNNNPIGVFDSGMGGLSVWRELRKKLPNESLLFFGDGLRCPYGERSLEEIRQYADEAVDWMLKEGVKMVVVACNTATAAAIDYLREKYTEVPLVGLEPAVKPAALSTKSGKIAVMATAASFKGELYKQTSAKYGDRVEIIPVVGEGFVELVESNQENTPEAYETVRRVMEPLIGKGIDKIVLGCTHYPFLMEQIDRVIGGRDIEVIDSAPAVARHVANLLKKEGLQASENNLPTQRFHTLADECYLERLIEKSKLAENTIIYRKYPKQSGQ